MIQKLIVMLVSVVRGRIQERTWNFGHLVHETCPRNCVWSVFKFYKKQTKSKNHETCWDVVISYETFSNFYHRVRIWYHDILINFIIFVLRLFFIEFKNNSTASSWSCFVNKMFEIGGLFLDMTSHYTK